jgi:hypothetical protein
MASDQACSPGHNEKGRAMADPTLVFDDEEGYILLNPLTPKGMRCQTPTVRSMGVWNR